MTSGRLEAVFYGSMKLLAVLVLLPLIAVEASPDWSETRRKRPPANTAPSIAMGRPQGFGDWNFARAVGQGRVFAFREEKGRMVNRRILKARELAELFEGRERVSHARDFIGLLDSCALEDGCEPRDRFGAHDVDPAIAPNEHFERPVARLTGRIAPCFGGWLIERWGRTVNGGWQRYRVFLAPGVYLVEKWDEP